MENKDFIKTDFELSENKEQIVTYIDDGEIPVKQDEAPKPSYSLFASAGDSLRHTVNDFLSRPIEIKNFKWNSNEAAGTELGERLLLPEDWLSISMVRDKLLGFQYLRCGYKVKVQVNAQPFNAGRLIVMFDPLFVQQRYIPSNLRSFGGLTGYSRVDLDLSVDTAVELDVPFLSNITHFDLVKAIGNLGAVRIYVYSPLTGSTQVSGTVWVQAYDVQTEMATGISPWNRAKIQSAKQEMKVVQGHGPVSEIAGAVCSAAGALTGVPVIGTAAQTVGWVASAIRGVASVFGWSKPIDDTVVQKVAPQFGQTFTNYQGDTKSKVLALSAENSTIIPTEIFGTDKDEMAFSHILSRPVYLDRFNLKATDPVDGVIWKMPVSPAACVKEIADGYVSFGNTYLSYFSQMFRNWRGSIKYHFKVVKTIYHSTRIRIMFVPGGFVDTDLSLIDVSKSYSKIFDIRQLTDFEFEVPFVHNQQWMSLTPISQYKGTFCETLCTGVLYCEVINPLTNSASAADSIEFIVEVSAGDDFQFSYPYVDPDIVLLPKQIGDTVSVFRANHKIGAAAVGKKYSEPSDTNIKDYLKKLSPAMLGGTAVVYEKKWVVNKSGRRVAVNVAKRVDVPPETPLVTSKTDKKALPVLEAFDVNDLPYAKQIPSVINLQGTRPTVLYTSRQRVDMIDKFKPKDEDMPVFRHLYPATSDFISEDGSHMADSIPEIPSYPNYVTQTECYPLQPLWAAWITRWNLDYPEPTANHDMARPMQWAQFQKYYKPYKAPSKAKIQSAMFESKPSAPMAQNVFAMGEVITSLRQLLRRYMYVGVGVGDATSLLRIYPYASAGYTADSDGFDPFKNSSFWDRVSAIYRWQSGSIRVAVCQSSGYTNRDNVDTASIAPGWLTFSSPAVNKVVTNAGRPNYHTFEPLQPCFPNSEELMEFSVPFYQRVPAIPTSLGGMEIFDLDVPSYGNDYVPFNLGTSFLYLTLDNTNFYTAIGEDFSFGYLVGPPITGRKTP